MPPNAAAAEVVVAMPAAADDDASVEHQALHQALLRIEGKVDALTATLDAAIDQLPLRTRVALRAVLRRG